MKNYIKLLIPIILWNIIVLSCIKSDALDTPLLINCGLPKSTRSESPLDGRVWQSDDGPAFAPSNLDSVSTNVSENADDLPYKVGRVLWSDITYTFSITPGPIFIRLYFFPNVSSNNTPPHLFSTSLLANNYTLLHNFNPFLNSVQETKQYEFQLILENGENNLKLTFSPGRIINNNTRSTFGYINGIEIESIPEGLYINESNPNYLYAKYPVSEYSLDQNSTAFQTAYRLNVGGENVDRNDDNPGGMKRKWEADEDYVMGERGIKLQPDPGFNNLEINYTKKTPAYVAPKIVYGTRRSMGDNSPDINLGRNITWTFEVDPGFDYVVRLHLCELGANVTGILQRVMEVYIDGILVDPGLDIWAEAGGRYIPMYKDFVISLPPPAITNNASKVALFLALHPLPYLVTDISLSGLEILKLSDTTRNLAVPNPPYTGTDTTSLNQTPSHKSSIRKILFVIGGVISGLLLVSVLLLALFRRRLQYNKLFMSTKSSSKGQWLPASVQSQSSTATTKANSSRPSLPSDLCRRFSLSEIRVATCDFDEDLVVGTGGFGKVYKGCIDDGAISVAIKRLNSTSKQGEHEFLTEIEMLSRLRHVHLVSLIGYCEDQGEMILVYEYMPRGTLRDHLNYKDTKGKDENEVLSWKQRLMICIGSARGLDYLHAGAKQLIIHRDVKSTNILLDDKWTAKVSDFGLSKVGPASDTGVGHVSTVVKGSFGYLDPEYYKRGQLTEKSDVFSFGVVLFEVLCARPAINVSLPKEQVNLANWGRACYKKGTLYTIVDPNLSGQIAPECLRKFGEIADMCVRSHRDERPSMRDIVWSLEFALTLQQTAEKNTSNVSPMVKIPSNTTDVASEGDDGDGGLTNPYKENMTQSSGVGVDTGEFGSNTGSTATTNSTITNYNMDIKSGSVFSEILDPRAR
ncbi:receptor-like protein kinase FERONIA [Silene latifolia]|uniref:receptor-like protein kinase FERONIA n=1 Tax=Silene latifolia TaxID=37657 RepID=UPI003D7720BB